MTQKLNFLSSAERAQRDPQDKSLTAAEVGSRRFHIREAADAAPAAVPVKIPVQPFISQLRDNKGIFASSPPLTVGMDEDEETSGTHNRRKSGPALCCPPCSLYITPHLPVSMPTPRPAHTNHTPAPLQHTYGALQSRQPFRIPQIPCLPICFSCPKALDASPLPRVTHFTHCGPSVTPLNGPLPHLASYEPQDASHFSMSHQRENPISRLSFVCSSKLEVPWRGRPGFSSLLLSMFLCLACTRCFTNFH